MTMPAAAWCTGWGGRVLKWRSSNTSAEADRKPGSVTGMSCSTGGDPSDSSQEFLCVAEGMLVHATEAQYHRYVQWVDVSMGPTYRHLMPSVPQACVHILVASCGNSKDSCQHSCRLTGNQMHLHRDSPRAGPASSGATSRSGLPSARAIPTCSMVRWSVARSRQRSHSRPVCPAS